MPHIGVFWIVNNKVDGFKEPVENGEDYGDTVQPSCDHFTYWDEFILRYPQLRLLEYDEIPRGRVVYNKRKKRFVILSSKKVLNNKNLIESVCQFYNLKEDVELRWDEHYEIQGET
ncbi:MAG: hypothetical protein ABGX27_08880 [Desulfurobacteriaceae bacterium]